jgi:hypothetical protein
MIDPSLQARFARSCSDAAVGYANAATAAYANWATQAFELVAGAMRSMQPDPPPRSWYREPPPAAQDTTPGLPVPAMPGFPVPWMPFAWAGLPTSPSPVAGANPVAAWFDMLGFRGPAAAWPMAFMMVAVGIPRNVAWPTAEANAAAIEAADAARRSLETAFSAYRTDGGHASTQVTWSTGPANGAAPTPAFPFPFWPWFPATR